MCVCRGCHGFVWSWYSFHLQWWYVWSKPHTKHDQISFQHIHKLMTCEYIFKMNKHIIGSTISTCAHKAHFARKWGRERKKNTCNRIRIYTVIVSYSRENSNCTHYSHMIFSLQKLQSFCLSASFSFYHRLFPFFHLRHFHPLAPCL